LGRGGELASPADFEWVLDAVMAARHGKPFDVAFELKPGVGQRSIATQVALARRNAILCEAARRFWPGSKARAARELSSALRQYEATAWRRERIHDEVPSRHKRHVQAYCWLALREWPQPLSAAHIRRILRCARNAPFHAQPEM
jgi:hypothetical protein